MADQADALLREIFRAIPAHHRVAFLKETLRSLDHQTRNLVLAEYQTGSRSKAPHKSAPPAKVEQPKSPPPPKRRAAKPSTSETPRSVAESLPPIVETQDQLEKALQQSPQDKQQQLQSVLQAFDRQKPMMIQNETADMKKELFQLLILVIAAGATLVGIGVLGKFAWDWLSNNLF